MRDTGALVYVVDDDVSARRGVRELNISKADYTDPSANRPEAA